MYLIIIIIIKNRYFFDFKILFLFLKILNIAAINTIHLLLRINIEIKRKKYEWKTIKVNSDQR